MLAVIVDFAALGCIAVAKGCVLESHRLCGALDAGHREITVCDSKRSVIRCADLKAVSHLKEVIVGPLDPLRQFSYTLPEMSSALYRT